MAPGKEEILAETLDSTVEGPAGPVAVVDGNESSTQRGRPVRPSADSFGSVLQRHRRRKDWSQAELARKIDVSTTMIYKWEHGLMRPGLFAWRDLVATFELNPIQEHAWLRLLPTTSASPAE